MIALSFPHRSAFGWPLRVVRLVGLVALIVAVAKVSPHPGWSGEPLVLTSLIAIASAGWLCWLIGDGLGGRWQVPAVLLIGLAGGVLAGLSPNGVAVVFPAVALGDAATRLPYKQTLAVTAAVLAATTAGHLVNTWHNAFAHLLLLVACALLGAFRWQQLRHIEQSDLLGSQVQRAAQEQARAATLAERARIARELHDVQAHVLAALSVQLKVIDALVEQRAEPDRVRAFVTRAEELTREGLVETRRAVLVLRDEVLDVVDLLGGLAEAYTDRDGRPAEFGVTGTPVTLPTDTAMVLYRAAQEALTNVRKHAEGSPVDLAVAYAEKEVTLTVGNELVSGETALSAAGAGYGLRGLTERAEAVGGTLSAGPEDARWRLCLRIPL